MPTFSDIFSVFTGFAKASEVTNDSGVSGTYVNNALDTLDSSKADSSHTHAQTDINGLVADLASKADATHTHAQSDITDLVADLAAKQETSEKGIANGYASLDASGKVPASQLTISGGINPQGAWDANTNTPTLVDGTGTNGDLYVVQVAGTQDLGSGSQAYAVGDKLIYDGSVWQYFVASDLVSSVFGRVGAVVANASDYDASQIDNDSGVAGATVADALDSLAGLGGADTAAIRAEINKLVHDGTGLLLLDETTGEYVFA